MQQIPEFLTLSVRVTPLLIIGLLLAVTARKFFKMLDGGDEPGIQGHWGGFGGTKLNWHISKSLALLILCAILAVALTVSVALVTPQTDKDSNLGRPEKVRYIPFRVGSDIIHPFRLATRRVRGN